MLPEKARYRQLQQGELVRWEGKTYEVLRVGAGSAYVRGLDKIKRVAKVTDRKNGYQKEVEFEVPDKPFHISKFSIVERVSGPRQAETEEGLPRPAPTGEERTRRAARPRRKERLHERASHLHRHGRNRRIRGMRLRSKRLRAA